MNKRKQKNYSHSKNKILALYIVAIVIISLLTVTSYAKYITTIKASTDIPIGKWMFKVNNSEAEDIGKINLGQKTYTAETLAKDNLAPGTEGTFKVSLDASQIKTGVRYSVAFNNIKNKPENLYFKVGNNTYYDFETLAAGLGGVIDANDTKRDREIEVNWIWDYVTNRNGTIEDNDKLDTAQGKAAQTFSFDILVTGTQILPSQVNNVIENNNTI